MAASFLPELLALIRVSRWMLLRCCLALRCSTKARFSLSIRKLAEISLVTERSIAIISSAIMRSTSI